MLHPDEGIIHELLDGELAGSEAETVRRHLTECGDCRRLYQEAQDLVAESDRAIGLLDDIHPELTEAMLPKASSRPEAATAADESDFGPGLPPPPAANVRAGPPIVLMPSAPQPPRWRRARPRGGLWAAVLLLLAGGGYLVFGRSSEPSSEAVGASPTLENFPLAGKTAPPSDSAADAQVEARAAAALASRPPLGAALPAPVKADSVSKRDDRSADTAATRLAAANQPAAKAAAVPAGTERTKVAEPAAPSRALAARSQRATADVAADNRAAENPTAGAAAATEQPAAPAPPPMPPSLDAQARITTRIGLDDAKRELGSPLHGIDGLRPRLVGIIPGRLVPGADPSRNVVRAVYTDRNGTPFYLDQQRMSTSGGQRPSGGLVRGDVQLFLNGDLPADSAGALAQRVR